MIELPLTQNENTRKIYEDGFKNKVMWLYYIFQQGNAQVNSLHSLILGFLALAISLRIEHDYFKLSIWAVVFLVGTTIAGWLWLRYGKKTFEYRDLMRTTLIGRYGMEMSETNIKQNSEIIALLKDIKGK